MIIDFNDLKKRQTEVCFPLINGVSKRAREIVDDEQNFGDNAVAKAFDEFKSGEFVIISPDF